MVHTHTLTHTYMHTCIHMHAYTYIHTCIHMHAYTYIQHLYIHMDECIHQGPWTSTWFHSQTICDLDVIRAVCALIEFLAMRKRSEGWRRWYHHVLCRRLQPSHDLLQSFYYSLPSSIKPPHREFGGSVSPFFLCIHVMHQSMCLNVYVYLDVSVNA